MTRRTRSSRSKQHSRSRPGLEILEARTVPANLWITDGYFIDGYNTEGYDPRLANPTVGTQANFRVEFMQEGVPAGEQYLVVISLPESIPELISVTSPGPGLVPMTVTSTRRGLIGPGSVSAFVNLDGFDEAIEETNEADNAQTFTFTPTTFTPVEGIFANPLPGTPLIHWYINNYVDLDPDEGDGDDAKRDYTGGEQTYDGHHGLDIGVGSWAAMDIGVPIFAVASGVVVNRDDGHDDRNHTDLSTDDNPPVNFVEIDHGDGWRTTYYHMRRNSVTVQIGDIVKPGDILGLVGSSGRSTEPHLHFEVRHRNLVVETYLAPSSYWITPAPYTVNDPAVFPDPNSYFITENSGNAAVFLTSLSIVQPPGIINYSTYDSTAQAGLDYQQTSGSAVVVIPTPVSIPIVDDANQDPYETFGVEMENVTIGVTTDVSVTIVDNDFPVFYDRSTGDLVINATPGALDELINLSVQEDHLVLNTVFNGTTLFPLAFYPNPNENPPLASLNSITINLSQGDHTIVLDLAGGNPIPAGGLFVNGGSGHDKLTISGSPLVVLDDSQVTTVGFSFSYTLFGVEEIEIDPLDVGPANVRINDTPADVSNLTIYGAIGDQDDLIDIEAISPNTTVEVDAVGGNDTVILGLIAANLDYVQSPFAMIIRGNLGEDILILQDQADSDDNTYALFPGGLIEGGFSRNSSLFIGYDGFETFEFTTGSGDDTVFVQATVAGTETHINAGPGDDIIRVDSNGDAPGGTVNGVQSALFIDGWGGTAIGTDLLVLNDESDGSTNVVTVTPESVSGTPFFGPGGGLWYEGLSDLTIYLGSSSDVILVEGTGSGTTTTINGGRGSDHFKVAGPGPAGESGAAGDGRGGIANAIQSLLILNGQVGEDSLVVDDSLETANNTLTVEALMLGAGPDDNYFGPHGTLHYDSFATLSILAGAGTDVINVWATKVDTATTISAGPGADLIAIGNLASTLSEVVGPLQVNGQSQPALGIDTLQLKDSGVSSPQTYLISASAVQRSGAALISYATLENLSINSGSGNDGFTIVGTPAALTTFLKSGPGNDAIQLGSPAGLLDPLAGAVVVDGQAGSDSLTINDHGTLTGKQYALAFTPLQSSIERTGSGRVSYLGLEGVQLNAGSHEDTFTVTASVGVSGTPLGINAGAGPDVLHGPDLANTWRILGGDNGQLNGSINFLSIQSLHGGTGADEFIFSNGAGVSGVVDGGDGVDLLNYSAYLTPVLVDLVSGSATGVGVLASGTFENLTGGTANDRLRGNANGNVISGGGGADVLLGRDGNDVLLGGAGRDLLIGGTGADELRGGDDDDLLVNGTTSHDANNAALETIMSEWTSLASDYQSRILHLRNGGGLNGAIRLNSSFVFDDASVDQLFGDGGLDWYWARSILPFFVDAVRNLENGERVN